MDSEPAVGPDLVLSVNDQNYSDFLTGNSVVSFGIASCEPCAQFDPILKEAAELFRGKVKFGKAKMHVPGACREIKRKFDFETFPTTHLYRNGDLAYTLEKKVDLDELAGLIRKHLLSRVRQSFSG